MLIYQLLGALDARRDRKEVAVDKHPDPEWVRRMQELRRSSAASPQRNRAKYDRKVAKRQARRESW